MYTISTKLTWSLIWFFRVQIFLHPHKGVEKVSKILCFEYSVNPTHLFDGEVINKVMVVLIEAAVQRYTVWVDKQVLQGCHTLQAQRTLHTIRQVGVIEDHAKTKGLGPQSHRLANTPCNTKTNNKLNHSGTPCWNQKRNHK